MNINKMISEMTLKEKIYQTIILRQNNEFYEGDEEFWKKNIKEKPYGGVFVGDEIIGGTGCNYGRGDCIDTSVARFRKYAAIEPFVCADIEYGCGYMYPDDRYAQCPRQMALGAANDNDLAYEYGKYTAIAARDIGINLALAPVADINMNFHNPIVNNRGISDKPQLVADIASNVAKGMQDYGIGATAKHFPGDGTDYRDQHFVLTNMRLSVEEWEKSFGMIYKRLISEGVMCIMAGHIAFPAYQQERIDGIAPPATLSKELITDLLKNKLGFEGAVMSDALCMNGFCTTYRTQVESEIECFKSGMDIMLWPSEEFAEVLEQKIVEGEIPEERLDDAVRRILKVKERLGMLGNKVEFLDDSLDGIHAFDDKVAEKAITLVRDRHGILPKKDIKRVAIIALTNYEDEVESLNKHMKKSFEERGAEVYLYKDEVPNDKWPENLDMIVYVTFCRDHKPCGSLTIAPSWQTASYEREKAVVVALGSPYLINSNFPTVNMAITTYSDSAGCQRAVVKGIFGEIEFNGKLPVEMPEI